MSETQRPELKDVLRSQGREALVREAEQAGLQPKAGRLRCPFDGCRDQGEKRARNVSIYVGEQAVPRVKCFRCGTSGSLVDLLGAVRGWSANEAIAHLLGLGTPIQRAPLQVVRQHQPLEDPDKLSPADVRSAWDALARKIDDPTVLAYLERRALDGAVARGHEIQE